DLYDILGEEGILNIGATSNTNADVSVTGDIPSLCTSPYLIVVTTCGEYDNVGLDPSGYNKIHVDLAAPGERLWNITSSPMQDMFGLFGGTSSATPVVT